ncbi:MAG: phosphomannomutase/phosphoglucomutase [Pusillimonas sp.]|jgi:phosphomannomutase/phosphoglucomutase|nr:phosphomannomutase/phosphoglucomutase [Pusillimonas sp.]
MSISDAVFKAYDIRGTVPDQIQPDFARGLGAALAQMAKAAEVDTVVVGYDGRLSSPALSEALQNGLTDAGINTVDLGCVPTPLVYFAAHTLGTGSGVAITGSHNPSNYNGFKMMMAGKTLFGEQIQTLKRLMQNGGNAAVAEASTTPTGASTKVYSPVTDYINRIVSDVKLARPIKIAIDCGNGVGGVAAPALFRALGCEVLELFCEIDGRFPNHHPDPADPDNLQDLIQTVKNTDCELGLAFDGDADRLGVVTKSGEIIWPDRQLILYARDVLSRNPGATIIFDVKCSRHVGQTIRNAGGTPLMWQTGHSMIKAKLQETGAPLAGEMSGHTFFKERWFGFDDGLYTGARLLEILSSSPNPSEVLEALPKGVSTPELKLHMQEGEPHALITKLQAQGQFSTAIDIIKIDGVRAEYADGFGLARASNTTPVVVLRFEGDNEQALTRIQSEFRQALQKLAPDAVLPF